MQVNLSLVFIIVKFQASFIADFSIMRKTGVLIFSKKSGFSYGKIGNRNYDLLQFSGISNEVSRREK
jgi:hypothetical protein